MSTIADVAMTTSLPVDYHDSRVTAGCAVSRWNCSSSVAVRRASSAGVPSKTILPSWMNSTRSATGSTSWRMWVETRIVFDLPEVADQRAHAADLVRVESAGRLVHDQDFRVVQAAPGPSRRAGDSPWRACRSACGRPSPASTGSMTASIRLGKPAEPDSPRAAPKNFEAGRAGSCRDRAGRSRADSRGARPRRSGRAWTSMPAIRAEPCVGATKPVRSRIVVVLPAPLGPRKATTWPAGDRERDVADRQERPELLAEPVGFDHHGRGHAVAILILKSAIRPPPPEGLGGKQTQNFLVGDIMRHPAGRINRPTPLAVTTGKVRWFARRDSRTGGRSDSMENRGIDETADPLKETPLATTRRAVRIGC